MDDNETEAALFVAESAISQHDSDGLIFSYFLNALFHLSLSFERAIIIE
jgi:hypothetical protein